MSSQLSNLEIGSWGIERIHPWERCYRLLLLCPSVHHPWYKPPRERLGCSRGYMAGFSLKAWSTLSASLVQGRVFVMTLLLLQNLICHGWACLLASLGLLMTYFTVNLNLTSSVWPFTMATRTMGGSTWCGLFQSGSPSFSLPLSLPLPFQRYVHAEAQCGMVGEETQVLARHLPLAVDTSIDHTASGPHVLHGSVEMVVSSHHPVSPLFYFLLQNGLYPLTQQTVIQWHHDFLCRENTQNCNVTTSYFRLNSLETKPSLSLKPTLLSVVPFHVEHQLVSSCLSPNSDTIFDISIPSVSPPSVSSKDTWALPLCPPTICLLNHWTILWVCSFLLSSPSPLNRQGRSVV